MMRTDAKQRGWMVIKEEHDGPNSVKSILTHGENRAEVEEFYSECLGTGLNTYHLVEFKIVSSNPSF